LPTLAIVLWLGSLVGCSTSATARAPAGGGNGGGGNGSGGNGSGATASASSCGDLCQHYATLCAVSVPASCADRCEHELSPSDRGCMLAASSCAGIQQCSVDPCNGRCSSDETCEVDANRNGSCRCKDGLQRDGDRCVPQQTSTCPGCGANAECNANNVCVCRSGFDGNPQKGCTPKPATCSGCGDNAECNATGSCVCKSGFVGNPQTGCTPAPAGCGLCGDNAECNAASRCVCKSGFIGNPQTGCVAAPSCTAQSVKGACIDVGGDVCWTFTGSGDGAAVCQDIDAKASYVPGPGCIGRKAGGCLFHCGQPDENILYTMDSLADFAEQACHDAHGVWLGK
jgi:hypothetical protein